MHQRASSSKLQSMKSTAACIKQILYEASATDGNNHTKRVVAFPSFQLWTLVEQTRNQGVWAVGENMTKQTDMRLAGRHITHQACRPRARTRQSRQTRGMGSAGALV
eukprot:1158243-Pelagomonas_calceolata.AAC.1